MERRTPGVSRAETATVWGRLRAAVLSGTSKSLRALCEIALPMIPGRDAPWPAVNTGQGQRRWASLLLMPCSVHAMQGHCQGDLEAPAHEYPVHRQPPCRRTWLSRGDPRCGAASAMTAPTRPAPAISAAPAGVALHAPGGQATAAARATTPPMEWPTKRTGGDPPARATEYKSRRWSTALSVNSTCRCSRVPGASLRRAQAKQETERAVQ